MAAAAAMEREEEAMEMGAVVRIVVVMEMEAEVCSAKSRTDFCGQAGALGAGLDLRPRCCRGTCVAWRSPWEARRPARRRRRVEDRPRPPEPEPPGVQELQGRARLPNGRSEAPPLSFFFRLPNSAPLERGNSELGEGWTVAWETRAESVAQKGADTFTDKR